jgi:hypothetical protein
VVELNQSEKMQMKAIDSLTVGARWLEQELETLLSCSRGSVGHRWHRRGASCQLPRIGFKESQDMSLLHAD